MLNNKIIDSHSRTLPVGRLSVRSVRMDLISGLGSQMSQSTRNRDERHQWKWQSVGQVAALCPSIYSSPLKRKLVPWNSLLQQRKPSTVFVCLLNPTREGNVRTCSQLTLAHKENYGLSVATSTC